ncbi:MAG: tRNA adenosine(34) deaminase TadA [Clostridia bacterium]|nr:tRNA adenosine(34) deaminase TadA [Clostridia bacterium]
MDADWMRMALDEAQLAAAEGEIPVGAVLVKDGQLLARAHNRREADHDPTSHAEMLCMRQAAKALGDWRLRGCTLYVTLEPCPMCAGAMVMSQLSQCVYGADDARQGCCGSVYDLPGDAALQGTTQWRSGVLAEECARPLKEFFAPRRDKA